MAPTTTTIRCRRRQHAIISTTHGRRREDGWIRTGLSSRLAGWLAGWLTAVGTRVPALREPKPVAGAGHPQTKQAQCDVEQDHNIIRYSTGSRMCSWRESGTQKSLKWSAVQTLPSPSPSPQSRWTRASQPASCHDGTGEGIHSATAGSSGGSVVGGGRCPDASNVMPSTSGVPPGLAGARGSGRQVH